MAGSDATALVFRALLFALNVCVYGVVPAVFGVMIWASVKTLIETRRERREKKQ